MPPLPLLDSFAEYLRYEVNRSGHTIEAYLRDVTQFAIFHAPEAPQSIDWSAIGHNDLRKWVATLGETETPRTLRRKIQSLRAFFRWLMKKRVLADNPASYVTLAKIDKSLPEFVRSEEMESILGSLKEEEEGAAGEEKYYLMLERVVLTLLYSTGIRQAELIGLCDSDVDTAAMEIKVTGKRNKQRVIPLHPEVCVLIDKFRLLRQEIFPETSLVFLPCRGKSLTKSQLYRMVKGGLENATVGKKSPHVLRHTFATGMLNGGASLDCVQEFLGHESLETTQIYTHLTLSDLRRAYTDAHPRQKRK